MQLSLWDTEEPTIPPGWVIWDPDMIMESSHRWADGDIRPASLERLAQLLLGDIESFMRGDGVKLFYRVTSTSVIGDHVECACQYMCTANAFYGGKSEPIINDEDEDEFL